MRKSRFTRNLIFSGVAVTLLSYSAYCLAEMSSQSYRVSADTVNAGGNLSSSSSYRAGDSMGEAATGEERSANYKSKTAFWYMLPEPLGFSCQASNVYMVDYTLGNANNYNKYLFSSSEECTIVDNYGPAWTLTMQSTNMTSARNNLSNTNIFLSTNGNVGTADTVTAPTTGLTETSGENSLDTPRTIINADVTASGVYNTQPTIKLSNLNTLYNESISGTLTITLQ